MNEFKKGDRVVFVKDDDYDGVEMPAGTLATYDDDAPTGGLVRWVRLDTGERVAAYPDVIAHAEDHGTGDGSASDICAEPGCNCDLERRFPAPLDPKAVKPGDTATVTDGKAIITGVVDSVRERAAQLWFRFRFGEQADAYFEVPLSDRFGEAFNLTAHQPAPEPKPYTPTREQIRQAYVDARGDADLITESEAGAEFDRWLDSLGLTR